MRHSLRWALALAALALARPAAGQDARATLAVLPFEDGGSYGQDKEAFEALRLGLPALLASELARHPETRVVERARVLQVLAAQRLPPETRIDATTATRLGGELGARYVVLGSFVDFYGRFRVNARVVDARTGEIVRVVSNDDPNLQDRAELFRIVQRVSEKVVAAAGLHAYPAAAAAGRARTIPTEALTQYSFALLHESRGDRSRAAEHFQRALRAYPDFAEAQEGLRRTRPS